MVQAYQIGGMSKAVYSYYSDRQQERIQFLLPHPPGSKRHLPAPAVPNLESVCEVAVYCDVNRTLRPRFTSQ